MHTRTEELESAETGRACDFSRPSSNDSGMGSPVLVVYLGSVVCIKNTVCVVAKVLFALMNTLTSCGNS